MATIINRYKLSRKSKLSSNDHYTYVHDYSFLNSSSIVVPPPGEDLKFKLAFIASALFCMLTRPLPFFAVAGLNPHPSSRIIILSLLSAVCNQHKRICCPRIFCNVVHCFFENEIKVSSHFNFQF